jgi:threonine dehydrogenase-like Zn-dependent dehydrogenase
MRAVRVVSPGKIEFVEVPEPVLQPGHALVRPLILSLCGSDVHMVYYSDKSEYPFPLGTSGHEIIGVVEAIDAPGYNIKPGDVALTLMPYQDGMAELLLTPADQILVLPEGRPWDQMLMAQQLGTVVYALKRVKNFLGHDVAVLGQGSAGLFFNAMCRRMGARRIVGIDIVQARVDAATKMGATHGVNATVEDPIKAVERITDGKMADFVVEAVGEVDAINQAAHLVKVGGQLLYFGVPRATEFTFDFWTLFRKYCYTTSSGASGFEPGKPSFYMALDLIASGAIDVCCMITHRFAFEQVMDAYELARTRDEGAIKVVIEMPFYARYKR